jgi:hypothetical protein
VDDIINVLNINGRIILRWIKDVGSEGEDWVELAQDIDQDWLF